MSNFNFINKTVIVTGGGTGIGYEIAKSFLNSGANVIITGRRKHILDKSIEEILLNNIKYKNKVFSIDLDLSNEDSVKELYNNVLQKYKRIDILINNSATWFLKPIKELLEEEIDYHFNNSFKTTVLCTKYASTFMKKGGTIVNIGSFASVLPMKDASLYSAYKSAIGTFTKSSAAELGKEGIRVNCIIPGVIKTPMTSDFINNNFDKIIKPIALKRIGTTKEVANGVLFFSSDLSSYITGSILEITGGKYLTQL